MGIKNQRSHPVGRLRCVILINPVGLIEFLEHVFHFVVLFEDFVEALHYRVAAIHRREAVAGLFFTDFGNIVVNTGNLEVEHTVLTLHRTYEFARFGSRDGANESGFVTCAGDERLSEVAFNRVNLHAHYRSITVEVVT